MENNPALDPLPVEPLFVEPTDPTPTPQDILDYASPRKRTKTRLPTNSHIVCNRQGAGIRITETLAGRSDAIGAMVFALFILIEWAYLAVSQEMRFNQNISDWLPGLLVMGIPWLAYLALLLAVIQQTWRKTILHVDPQKLILQFKGPLHRTTHRWPAIQLLAVQPAVTFTAENAWPLGELCLHLSTGGRVHLFTDHRLSDVERLATTVCAALTGTVATPHHAENPT